MDPGLKVEIAMLGSRIRGLEEGLEEKQKDESGHSNPVTSLISVSSWIIDEKYSILGMGTI